MKMDTTIATAREIFDWVTLAALTLPVLEWSASLVDEPWDENEVHNVACCPLCRGLKPDDKWVNRYTADQFGHRSNCALARLIREM